jgi:hypothetical protein
MPMMSKSLTVLAITGMLLGVTLGAFAAVPLFDSSGPRRGPILALLFRILRVMGGVLVGATVVAFVTQGYFSVTLPAEFTNGYERLGPFGITEFSAPLVTNWIKGLVIAGLIVGFLRVVYLFR